MVGDREMVPGHSLIFALPITGVQVCYIDTLRAVSTLDIRWKEEGEKSYRVEIGSEHMSSTSIKFSVECINPYTTQESEPLIISGADGSELFYRGSVTIHRMEEVNKYAKYYISRAHSYPSVVNTFTFMLTASQHNHHRPNINPYFPQNGIQNGGGHNWNA